MSGTNSLVRDVTVLVRGDLDALLKMPENDPRLPELLTDWLRRCDALLDRDDLRQQETKRLLDAHARFTDRFGTVEAVCS